MSDNQGNAQPSNLEVSAQEAARLSGMTDAERLAEELSKSRPYFMPSTPAVDSATLVKAAGRFIKAQTRFLLQVNQYGTSEYLKELSAYSQANTEYIDALQLALHQAGVL